MVEVIDNVWIEFLFDWWPHILGVLIPLVDLFTTGHVILKKRESRAAIGWVGLIWLAPIVGACIYFVFGINRIKRKARALQIPELVRIDAANFGPAIPSEPNMLELSQYISEVVERPLAPGNAIECYRNGDEAYPAMLEAIANSKSTIGLQSYIFDRDEAGSAFLHQLVLAQNRGVEVRVLIDGVGARYSFPSIMSSLKKAGLKAASFLPSLFPWRLSYANLRNHRKLLLIDGEMAFTGGMNIRQGNWFKRFPKEGIQDLHFKLEGPVVDHLRHIFAEDWAFAAKEQLLGERWFPPLKTVGATLARGIPDGPDEDFEKIIWTLLGAISLAQKHIRILTPYFIPGSTLSYFLNVASMRGVQVDILVPEINNLKLVQWAFKGLIGQVMQRNCRIFLTPPPFDHSKLMIVDDQWVLIGSSNWDPRSFQLNFEYNVECYDPQFAKEMIAEFEGKKSISREFTLEALNARSLPVRLRDGLARLASPYL